MILYVHGFGSDKLSGTGLKLNQIFGNVLHPSIPIEPYKAIDFLTDLYNSVNIDYVIGNSLGGFYSYFLYKTFNVKTILLNPSISPSETLKTKIGFHKRFNTKDEFEWKIDYCNRLELIFNDINNNQTDSNLLNVFINKDDEIIEYNKTLNLLSNIKNIKLYDIGGHRMSNFDNDILPEIKLLIK